MAKILVVEDERVAAWSIQESLEGFGHTLVAHVTSGSEAIRTAGETQPDLVLMDIQLEGKIDGISTAEQIRSLLKIPIIYLTAHANSRTLKRAISSRHPQGTPTATRYLIKPFNQADLHTTIEITLLRNQFEKRLEAIEHQLLNQAGDRSISVDLMNPESMNPIAEDIAGYQQWETSAQDSNSALNSDNSETFEVSVIQSPLKPQRVTLPEQCLLPAKEGEGQFIRNDVAPVPKLGTAVSTIKISSDHELSLMEAQLEQQVQERTAQLQQALDFEVLLMRITEKVRDSLDESQILQTAVKELTSELNITSCNTRLYDLDLGTSTIAHESASVPSAHGIVYMEDEEAICSQLLAGKAVQFCWIDSLEKTRPQAAGFATLACPLINDLGVVGDIWLDRVGENSFATAEVRLVQQVANQCAIAIRQAHLYTAVQQQVTELERLNQLKDDFLSTISHELRTPISSIKMASQLLEIRLNGLGLLLETDGTQIKRYLQILQSECDREISLINNMLDLSRLDAQMEPIHPIPIKLQDWIPHLLEPFAAQRQKQQQQLIVDIPVDLSPVVSDLASLGRVLTELLNNAFKYTPAHETIKVSACIESREVPCLPGRIGQGLKAYFPQQNSKNSQSTPTFFAIQVSNSGVKILPSEQARIFDKFYRVPNADPWKHGGTGLGLALVKQIVTHISGDIQVYSKQNWTTFTVYLPLN